MEPVILVKNLKKKFGNLLAVDDLSFEVRNNEVFGLLGPNGAGKTTTIRMICGLLLPTDGSIDFQQDKDPRSLIGYCPQENIFYPKLSCIEQLVFMAQMYGLSARKGRERAARLLGMLGLQGKTHVQAGKLSGGMKRRLNICLALIHDPEIIILDEPEAGLDPQSRILVREFIRKLGEEKTILLTTHNMDEADRMADRVLIMDHGKVILLDTPGKLKKTIGEGDILEIVPETFDKEAAEAFGRQVASQGMHFSYGEDTLFVKHPDLVNQIALIRSIADQSVIGIAELKLRENTLEDVFIHFTGRKLRE